MQYNKNFSYQFVLAAPTTLFNFSIDLKKIFQMVIYSLFSNSISSELFKIYVLQIKVPLLHKSSTVRTDQIGYMLRSGTRCKTDHPSNMQIISNFYSSVNLCSSVKDNIPLILSTFITQKIDKHINISFFVQEYYNKSLKAETKKS